MINGTSNESPFFGGQKKIKHDTSLDILLGKPPKRNISTAINHKMQYITNPSTQRVKRSHTKNKTVDIEKVQSTCRVCEGKSAPQSTRRQNNEFNKVGTALKTLGKTLNEIGGGNHIFLKAEEYILNKLK